MTRIRRTLSVFFRLVPFVVAFLRDKNRWILFGRGVRRSPEAHQQRADRLASTLAGLGPTFIKLAQLLSARADIFPEPYLSAVSQLQDQAPPDPTDEVVAVVEQELGRPVDELFAEFQRKPVAAASLGQVHRARLDGNAGSGRSDEGSGIDGRDVVVKVLRPGVEKKVALDLDISFRVLFWLNVLFPNHHVRALTSVVREFSVRVKEEMDFRKEAENMRHFREIFGHEEGVRVPRVVDRFVSRRVLVMERVEGTKINELQARFDSGELNLHDIMERLTGLYLRMMMVDGFLHADPHPGNLLVDDQGRVVLLDWGMVLRVHRWTREDILAVALAVEREDLDAMINGMYRLGMISPEISRSEIREAAIEVMKVLEAARGTSQERLEEILHSLYDTFYTWPLVLPQELVYFFRAGALLEGIGFRYDPRFNGLDFMRGVIRRHQGEIARSTGLEPVAIAKNFLDEAQQAIRSLRELIARAEREELRVRVHPRDVQGQERFLHLQARRMLLSVFATATALITAILFISVRSWWLLGVGLFASLMMFVLVFLIPTHLLENPLRHARGVRSGERRR